MQRGRWEFTHLCCYAQVDEAVLLVQLRERVLRGDRRRRGCRHDLVDICRERRWRSHCGPMGGWCAIPINFSVGPVSGLSASNLWCYSSLVYLSIFHPPNDVRVFEMTLTNKLSVSVWNHGFSRKKGIVLLILYTARSWSILAKWIYVLPQDYNILSVCFLTNYYLAWTWVIWLSPMSGLALPALASSKTPDTWK